MNMSKIPQTIAWVKMPLFVYREVAAHLGQVSGVEVVLLTQAVSDFDYELGQVGGLHIRRAPIPESEDESRVLEILNYYGDRFGDWQAL
jgi:hypothetical protein